MSIEDIVNKQSGVLVGELVFMYYVLLHKSRHILCFIAQAWSYNQEQLVFNCLIHQCWKLSVY